MTKYEISSLKDLREVIDAGSEYTDDSGKCGFWLIEELLGKDKSLYGDLQGGTHYVAFCDGGKVIGIMIYTLRPDSIHILGLQTLPTIHGLSQYYFDTANEIAVENGKDFITLRCYTSGLASHYSRYGFQGTDSSGSGIMKKRVSSQISTK